MSNSSKHFASISIASLRVGVTLNAPIYHEGSAGDVLLLSEGTTLTSGLLDRLAQRGITQVLVNKTSLNTLIKVDVGTGFAEADAQFTALAEEDQSSGSKQNTPKKNTAEKNRLKKVLDEKRSADQLLKRQRANRIAKLKASRASNNNRRTKNSFLNSITQRTSDNLSNEAIEEALQVREVCAKKVDIMYDNFELGNITDTAESAFVCAENLLQIAKDIDLFLAVGIRTDAKKYPSHHSLQTAMLAMSIGTIHGLSKSELMELGVGCLIHDLGMLHIDKSLYNSSKVLTDLEFLEITKHPGITLDLLQSNRDISSSSLMVAYQTHERCDGSGYPRKRKGAQIHFFSKIAAVADAYISRITTRPFREAMLPYHAIEQILHDTRNGKFDAAITRSLLHTVSLFPVGSYVELNDGRIGRIIRSNRENYHRPILEVWTPETLFLTPETIDLFQKDEKELWIERPIPTIRIADEKLVAT